MAEIRKWALLKLSRSCQFILLLFLKKKFLFNFSTPGNIQAILQFLKHLSFILLKNVFLNLKGLLIYFHTMPDNGMHIYANPNMSYGTT